MKFLHKKIIPLFLSITLLTSILPPRIINAQGPSQTNILMNCSDTVSSNVYRDLAQRLGLMPEDLESRLSFKIDKSTYRLILLTDSVEHREFWKKLWCFANPFYMQFFLTGQLQSEQAAMEGFDRRLYRMYGVEKICAMTFISMLDGQLNGMISVGPLNDSTSSPEIGYIVDKQYSGKGFATFNAKTCISFLQCLKDMGRYTFTSVIATAHPDNIGSCKVLEKSGFLTDNLIKEFSYGPRKIYKYNFS